MTINELIRAECANLTGGRCLGLTAYCKPFRAEGSCAVMAGKPCSYFRDAVLPLAKSRGEADLIREYARRDRHMPGLGKIDRETRRCDCGEALPPRKRLCSNCAEKKRKETYRAAQAKRRIP